MVSGHLSLRRIKSGATGFGCSSFNAPDLTLLNELIHNVSSMVSMFPPDVNIKHKDG